MIELPDNPKILVVRLSSLGDVLQTLPSVEALKRARPDAQISWLVEERYRDVLDTHRDVEEVLAVSRKKWEQGLKTLGSLYGVVREAHRFSTDLRFRRFDCILDFQGNLKSAFWGILTGARMRVGFSRKFSREGNNLFLTHRVSPDRKNIHRIRKYRRLVEEVDPDVSIEPPTIYLEPSHRKFAGDFLKAHGLQGEDYFVLHPGTSEFGKIKRWPLEKYRKLCSDLYETYDMPSVITWGPGEKEMAVEVCESEPAILGPRTGSILDLAALIKESALFVGSDSAPAHLSSFLQKPTVVLFGPKDPEVYGPFFGPVKLIYKNVWCSPCQLRTCPRIDCMKAIEQNDVLGAIADLEDEFVRPAVSTTSSTLSAVQRNGHPH